MKLFSSYARSLTAIVSLCTLTLTVGAFPSLAADPFRKTNVRDISENTAAAFTAVFEKGNYPLAKQYLDQGDANEPMTYALRASLAYASYPPDMETFRVNATRTREVAEQLVKTDPLRGNLYTAVGHFLEAAYILVQQGPGRGSPQALSKLQEVFKYMKAAEKIAPDDPELNMVKGFMDLMLAVNLPFSNANQAIERLDKYAAPRYLANRGIALGYRDLGQYDQANDYINRTLGNNLEQPEDNYIKAQILAAKAQRDNNPALNLEASKYFKVALQKSDQLPRALVWQMFFEYCNNQIVVDRKGRDCAVLRDKIDRSASLWGPKPTELPQL